MNCPHCHHSLTLAQIAEQNRRDVLWLREQGLSLSQIVKRTGLGNATVSKYINQADLSHPVAREWHCQRDGCDNHGTQTSPGSLRKWCSEKCRKTKYDDQYQACVDCGAPTSHGPRNGYATEPRCLPCATDHNQAWTRERVLDRIREWADNYGEPPAVPDWCPWNARHRLHDEARARRFEDAAGYWPHHNTVFRLCGSWNAALEALAFTSRPAHGGGGNGLRRRVAA